MYQSEANYHHYVLQHDKSFIMWMTLMSTWVDREGEGSPIETTHSTQVFFHFEPEAVRMFLLRERLKLQPLGAETARYMYM